MFDWDEGNVEHLVRHGVEAWEVEEVFESETLLSFDVKNRGGEKRRGVIGATESGRIIAVVFTSRDRKIRPITAYDASSAQKRRYRKEKQ